MRSKKHFLHTLLIPYFCIDNCLNLCSASALFANSCSIFYAAFHLSAPVQLLPENFEIFIIVLKYLCMHIIEYTCRPFVAVPLGKTWREDTLVFPEKSHSKLQSIKLKLESLQDYGNIQQENIQCKKLQYKNIQCNAKACSRETHNAKVFKEVGMFRHHAEHHADLYGLQEFTLLPLSFACEKSFILSSERRKHGKNSGN